MFPAEALRDRRCLYPALQDIMHRCVSLRSGSVPPKDNIKTAACCSDSAAGHASIKALQGRVPPESLGCLKNISALLWENAVQIIRDKKLQSTGRAGRLFYKQRITGNYISIYPAMNSNASWRTINRKFSFPAP